MKTLFINIGQIFGVLPPETSFLKGIAMSRAYTLEDGWMLVVDGKIAQMGLMSQPLSEVYDALQVIDLEGKHVLPSFCDSHTHLVFASSRENEMVARIQGKTYVQIAQEGGGILNSAKKLEKCSDQELFEGALIRIKEMMHTGTTAFEIKSGYGLSALGEIKMLRVIQRLKESLNVDIKSTFLGAHAIPEEYKNNRTEYIQLLINLLPQIKEEKLADYMDVFCDTGFFTPQETALLLSQGEKYGLKPKIHANELGYSGGVQVGVEHHAVSVDHLEFMGPEEIAVMQKSNTIATLLPSTAFFLNFEYPKARHLIDSDLPIALASDYNPGSSPSGNMPLVISLACTQMKMLPVEAIHASTINGAAAMELSHNQGSLTFGKKANFIVLKSGMTFTHIPYFFGKNLIDQVYVQGQRVSA